eukprot:6179700-Pleurochrysis_carterae.AAC.3
MPQPAEEVIVKVRYARFCEPDMLHAFPKITTQDLKAQLPSCVLSGEAIESAHFVYGGNVVPDEKSLSELVVLDSLVAWLLRDSPDSMLPKRIQAALLACKLGIFQFRGE